MASFKRLLVVLITILMVEVTLAQDFIPDCASKLVPCVSFLNSTKPPESCCKPLREALATQRACLCTLFSNPGLIQSFGINITQALELPKHCGVSSNTSLCSSAPAPAPGMTPTTSRMTPPPPALAPAPGMTPTTSGMTPPPPAPVPAPGMTPMTPTTSGMTPPPLAPAPAPGMTPMTPTTSGMTPPPPALAPAPGMTPMTPTTSGMTPPPLAPASVPGMTPTTSGMTPPPPGVPGNSAGKMAMTGASALILFWVSLMSF